MKKILLSFFGIVLFLAAFVIVIIAVSKRTINVKKAYSTYIIHGTTLEIYTIDSCEYIGYISTAGSSNFLTHKGNCKYCAERAHKLKK
ncbi:MAG: hypothetical protein PHX80_05545 [Candidatus Nanoarchaeia archaeon]|nr:hypothetical protein [Candidatus Nanoarchaeia archaeon]